MLHTMQQTWKAEPCLTAFPGPVYFRNVGLPTVHLLAWQNHLWFSAMHNETQQDSGGILLLCLS